ncbi:MAG: PilZ domain-containing protein [Myxococcota bacterium]
MERRRHPRIHLDANGGVDIVLSATDQSWRLPAELIDLSAGGANVRVKAEVPFTLTVGGPMTVWIADAATGIELPIGAKMLHRREEVGGRVVGLQWTDLRSVGGLLQPLFGRKFNRRGAFRVAPSRAESPLAVTLVAPPELRCPPTACAIVDISTGGIGVDAPLSFETDLQGRDTVQCLFRLPTASNMVIAAGRLVHRTLRGENVRYGLMFLHTEEDEFRPVHEAILNYVIKRQRELAEENELYNGGGIPLGALGPVGGRAQAK